MPVHDGAPFLIPAIDSILVQSYGDFEFIIIDDASQDETPAILAQQRDPRIRILTNESNLGIVDSLNRGLAATKGEYVARMDADDISLPERFAEQVAFLDSHPQIGLLGCGADVISPEGQYLQTMPPIRTTDGGLRWYNLFGNPLIHPSVMMRKELVMRVGGYDPEFVAAQDRDLWDRMFAVTQVAYLPEILLQRRIHRESISSAHSQRQAALAARVAQRAMGAVLGEAVDFELAAVMQSEQYLGPDQVVLAADLITRLYYAFTTKRRLSPSEVLFVRDDYAHRLFRMARRWPLDARMRAILMRAVATRPILIFHWLRKQMRERAFVRTDRQATREHS